MIEKDLQFISEAVSIPVKILANILRDNIFKGEK